MKNPDRRLPKLRAAVVCLAAALGIPATTQTVFAAPDFLPAFSTVNASGRAAQTSTRHSARAAPADARETGTVALVVTNCDDSGAGSLRDAVAQADGILPIDMTQLTCSTITLTSGALHLDASGGRTMIVKGPGAGALAIDGSGQDRVFEVTGTGMLVLYGLTLRNGAVDGNGGCIDAERATLHYSVVDDCRASGRGGGVYASSNLLLYDSRITGNESDAAAGAGGGAYSAHFVIARNSTIRGNTAPNGNGGGLFAQNALISYSTLSANHAAIGGGAMSSSQNDASLSFENCTISGNSAGDGGGIDAGRLYLLNSTVAFNTAITGTGGGINLRYDTTSQLDSVAGTIVAGNTAASAESDIDGDVGVVLTGDHDLIGVSTLAVPAGTISSDPMLGPLQDNGGPTATHALSTGSPAIDAGHYFRTYDQRGLGFAALVGSARDIGAYEVQATGVSRLVTSCGDSGSGSVRDAIAGAHSGDTIDLRASACGTIVLTSGALQFGYGNMTLLGPGPAALTISANQSSRIIEHEGIGRLTLRGMTFEQGHADDASTRGAEGGCIDDGGMLDIASMIIRDCAAVSTQGRAAGGGIHAQNLAIADSVVTGNAARSGSIAESGGIDVFFGDLVMRNTTVSGNVAVGASSSDYNRAGGLLFGFGHADIADSTISGNSAGDSDQGFYGHGGGLVLYAPYSITLSNMTISGNVATVAGGVLGYVQGGMLANSTIAFNQATAGGDATAGLELDQNFAFRLFTTIVANNLSAAGEADLGSGFPSSQLIGANNLVMSSTMAVPADTITDDPLLGTLQDNGGLTPTHALSSASPAIDRGSNVLNLAFDQRGPGFPRRNGGAADIGAFETGTDVIFADGFDGGSER